MTPTAAMLNELQSILAADTGSLAAAAALKLHLAQAAFVPSPSLTLGSLTEATFQGYAALSGPAGTQQTYFDELTGQRVIMIKPPAGGWHFQATGVTGLPQTIYGWYVTDNGNTTLWGAQLFTTPVPINASGDGVDVLTVRFGLISGALV